MTAPYSQSAVNQHILRCANLLKLHGFAAFYQAHVSVFCDDNNRVNKYRCFVRRTDRATRPLMNLQDMVTYSALYAMNHYVRFRQLLTLVQNESGSADNDKPVDIRVIDYGCGQGLASLALLEHLAHRKNLRIEFHLVEPSQMALMAAERYVTEATGSLNGDFTIHSHACTLDKIPTSVFRPTANTVHLFSNILDMAYLPYLKLSPLINQIKNMPGKHVCLAVSPSYQKGQTGFDLFREHFCYAKSLIKTRHIQADVPKKFQKSLIKDSSFQQIQGRAMALLFNHYGVTDCDD